MPIRSELRHYYRKEWHALAKKLRERRAHGVCECHGRCGGHDGPCGAEHLGKHPRTDGRVLLTCAHLDQDPRDHDPARLLIMCQSCHLRYDRQPAQEALRNRVALEIAGQMQLFEENQESARREMFCAQKVGQRSACSSTTVPPLARADRPLDYTEFPGLPAMTTHRASQIMRPQAGWSRTSIRRRLGKMHVEHVGYLRKNQRLYRPVDILRAVTGKDASRFFSEEKGGEHEG